MMTGTPLKWITREGCLLGTLTLPNHGSVIEGLRKRGYHELAFCDPVLIDAYRPWEISPQVSSYRRVAVFLAHDYHVRDGVHVHGATPEQIEVLPGFTFVPSLAYIRSLVLGTMQSTASSTVKLPQSQDDLEQAAWRATQELSQ